MTETRLNMDAVAARLGLAKTTVFRYRHRPSLHFPDPDGVSCTIHAVCPADCPSRLGRPWWYAATVDAWQAQRPGVGYRSDLHTAASP